MGVISRVRLGFVAVAFLLLMVGATSYLEFRRLHTTIETVTSEGNQRNALTEELLANIYRQANTVSRYMLTDSLENFCADSKNGIARISNTLNKLSQYETHKKEISKVEDAIANYQEVVQGSYVEKVVGSDGRYVWYTTHLMPAQQNLGTSVLNFLNASHKELTSNALNQLNNIYRSDLKILITILACMFIIFMFYILLRVFYLNPLINIKKGLEEYLGGDSDYDVKDGGIDEVKKINVLIEQVIQNSDKKEEDKDNS